MQMIVCVMNYTYTVSNKICILYLYVRPVCVYCVYIYNIYHLYCLTFIDCFHF